MKERWQEAEQVLMRLGVQAAGFHFVVGLDSYSRIPLIQNRVQLRLSINIISCWLEVD